VARSEDQDLLTLCDQGIFFMPELAYAFAVGRQVMACKTELFPAASSVTWQREIVLNATGPTDLVLTLEPVGKVLIEFKVSGKAPSYVSDVDKLLRTGGDDLRIFCALIDYIGDPDERPSILARERPSEVALIVEPIPGFPTRHGGYAHPTTCLVASWLVGAAPSWMSAA
jgi:hypothetical protein